MTISSESRKAGPFTGNGVTTSFPFTFKVFEDSDLRVVRTMPSGVEAELVLDSDYSVTLNPDQNATPGGTITYPLSGDPLPASWMLTAVGNIQALQETDLTNQGGFYPQVIEDALDRATILIQQAEEQAGRTLRLPVSDDGEGIELPSAPSRAGRVLGFDASGVPQLVEVVEGSEVAIVNRQKFTATAAQTDFTTSFSFTPGVNAVSVFLNGSKLVITDDYLELTDNTIRLNTGAAVSDTVEVVSVGLAAGNLDAVEAFAEAAAASAAAAEESAGRVDLGALDQAVEDSEAARDAAQLAEFNAEAAEVNAETAEANAEAAQLAAEAAQSGAESARDAALLSRGVFASTADALSKGVASLASVVAGSGGTNGTFDLAFSGGAGTGAAGVFVVAGGAVVSTVITATGRGYTSAPTVSFAASSGLTGASATAVIANNADVGEYFSVPVAASNDSLILYRVDAGPVATAVGDPYPSAASVSPLRDFPKTKLISAWLFDENEGDTVYDRYGSNNINLTTPTTPNVTRTNFGLRTSSGLIQTPTITGAKQIVILYRTGIDETGGFMISGGASSGSGVLQDTVTNTETNRYAGSGFDFHPVAFRASSGIAAYELNRGGWGLFSRDMTTTYNTILGFGGRHSTTTSRCANFEIACAFVFNATLSATEEEQLHNWVRREGVKRGIYIHRDDCSVRDDAYIVAGESNADGRSTVTDLSAADRALDLSRMTRIIPGNGSTNWRHADGYELTFNGQVTAPTLDFGPDFGVAFERRADAATVLGNARLLKLGRGSTFMAPSSTGVVAQNSWNVTELNNAGLFWAFIRHMQRGFQEMLSEGTGWKGVRMGFWIGLNDASSTTYAPDAATYQAYLQALLDGIKAQFAGIELTFYVFRAHPSDPSSNATALTNVRTGTDNFAAANPGVVTSFNTDSYGLEPDSVHYNAAGSKAMGQLLHG